MRGRSGALKLVLFYIAMWTRGSSERSAPSLNSGGGKKENGGKTEISQDARRLAEEETLLLEIILRG